MEWLTGLALLPALMCTVMMGGMALTAALGLRRNQDNARQEATAHDPNVDEARGEVLR